MGSAQQQSSLPGREAVRGLLTRSRQFAATAPVPVKIVVVALVCVFAPALVAIGLFGALAYAPYALWRGDRSWPASVSVALWGIAVTAALAHGADEPRYLLLLLPAVVSVAARVGLLGRISIPCRTAAWVLIWSLPIGIATFRIWHSQRLFGPAAAWLIALVVLGWRLAKALQDSREQSRRSAMTSTLAAPYAMATAAAGGTLRGGALRGGPPGTVAPDVAPPGAVAPDAAPAGAAAGWSSTGADAGAA